MTTTRTPNTNNVHPTRCDADVAVHPGRTHHAPKEHTGCMHDASTIHTWGQIHAKAIRSASWQATRRAGLQARHDSLRGRTSAGPSSWSRPWPRPSRTPRGSTHPVDEKKAPEGPVPCSRRRRSATHKMHTARTQDAPTTQPGFIQSAVTMATPHTHGTPSAPTSHTHHANSTHSTRPPLDPFLLSPTDAPQRCTSDTHGAPTMHT